MNDETNSYRGFQVRPFEKNPYQIRDDAEMDALVESVRENGILTPLIVRPIETKMNMK